jgi:hypothetical protein
MNYSLTITQEIKALKTGQVSSCTKLLNIIIGFLELSIAPYLHKKKMNWTLRPALGK